MRRAIVCVVVLSVLGAFGQREATAAGTRYYAFALKNKVNFRVSYQVRWGTYAWKSFTLDPGKTRYHYWTTTTWKAPWPRVRFDTILGDRKTTYYEYTPGVAFHSDYRNAWVNSFVLGTGKDKGKLVVKSGS